MSSSESNVSAQPADYGVYKAVIADIMAGKEELPSLPKITFDIRRAMADKDLSLQDLSQILAKDAALSAILLKYASSPLIANPTPPQTMLEVVRLLGLNQVERITMVHSVKSLFSIYSAKHRRLFNEAWRRLALKASLSTFIAKQLQLKDVMPDHVLMAALLTEVGTLGVLSAFKKAEDPPDVAVYVALCREYAKSLGAIALKQWRVGEMYLEVAQHVGDWERESKGELNLVDVINLGLYHSLKLSYSKTDLPPITSLSAYKKLEEPDNAVVSGGLAMVMMNVQEIKMVAKSLF